MSRKKFVRNLKRFIYIFFMRKMGWTARQRQMHSLHYVISYRASFKPELPDYFIRQYTRPGEIVADPFCGRGTTILQANLLGRPALANDINPLAVAITKAKVNPAAYGEILSYLNEVNWDERFTIAPNEQLLSFYHPDTLQELYALRQTLAEKRGDTAAFVEMLALSRLHGHSSGFFSAYSMPQLSVTVKAQQRINAARGMKPPYRAVLPRILTKASTALRDNRLEELKSISIQNRYRIGDARQLSGWPQEKVALIVTSPPFLDKVNYLADQWLEHWFLGINRGSLTEKLTQRASLAEWQSFISDILIEMGRILRPGGTCIIELGDILCRGKRINLDEVAGEQALLVRQRSGLVLRRILIHRQLFSKLSHCFNVTNNKKGTNTQRLLVLEKE